MKKTNVSYKNKNKQILIELIIILTISILMSIFIIAYFEGYANKEFTILAGLIIILVIIFGAIKRIFNLPSIFWLLYLLWSFITVFWAMSGKFFLREYSKIFISYLGFFIVVLAKDSRKLSENVAKIISLTSAILAVMSLAVVTIDKLKVIFPFFDKYGISFIDGVRVQGIFQNSNVEPSIYAFGFFMAFALISNTRSDLEHIIWTGVASTCMYSLIICFSIGATGSFAIGLVLFILFSGKDKLFVLFRIALFGITSLLFSLLSIKYYSSYRFIILSNLILVMLVSISFEILLVNKVKRFFDSKKIIFNRIFLLGIVLLLGFSFIALNVGEEYQFGNPFTRILNLKPGKYVLKIESDEIYNNAIDKESTESDFDNNAYGEISTLITSTSFEQVIKNTNSVLYEGTDKVISFSVPENSDTISITFSGTQGTIIRSAILNDNKKIVLKYKFIPDFIANTLLQKNYLTSETSVARRTLWSDGINLYKRSPIIGLGVGAFETGISQVQLNNVTTKYVHNHYIQILLEGGIIGLILFLIAIVCIFINLIKQYFSNNIQNGNDLNWILPALIAGFGMNFIQMFWDVEMSYLPFLIFCNVYFGLSVRTLNELTLTNLEKEKYALPSLSYHTRKTNFIYNISVKILLLIFIAIFCISIRLNMRTNIVLNTSYSSNYKAYKSMESVLKNELYEYNDVMLSYIMLSMEDTESNYNHREIANEYAERLSKVQSNSIPYYLVIYYYNVGEYDKSLDEAILGATYSKTNENMLNKISKLLLEMYLVDDINNTQLTQKSLQNLDKIITYVKMLIQYSNDFGLTLDENSNKLIETIKNESKIKH